MRLVAYAVIAAVLAVALHAGAMALWRHDHSAPFHSGSAMITCPMGYVCPVSPAALRAAFAAPTPEGFRTLTAIFVACAAYLAAGLIDRSRLRYRPPDPADAPSSPDVLRSTTKRE
jgi:hypothetical protein